MNVVFILAPSALLLSLSFMAAFIWATRSGQWDDLDLTPKKVLLDSTNFEDKDENTK